MAIVIGDTVLWDDPYFGGANTYLVIGLEGDMATLSDNETEIEVQLSDVIQSFRMGQEW